MISIIVAVDRNRAIGFKGDLLTFLPGDLPRFKKITTCHTVIMGRKTFDSLPHGPLKNRNNIVISRNKSLKIEGTTVFNSLQEAIDTIKSSEEAFIIGGGEVYKEAMTFADKLYITEIDKEFEADTYFPEFSTDWNLIDSKKNDDDPNLIFSYNIYTK